MSQSSCTKQTKVAVVWYNYVDGERFVVVGKNFPPHLKFGNQHTYQYYSNQPRPTISINFPAGKQDFNESLSLAAIRELAEETGGFFIFEGMVSPWTMPEYTFEQLKPHKININDLSLINEKPINFVMFNPWQKKEIEFDFFFFKLETENIELKKLNYFCESAIKLLPNKNYRHFKEVFGYEFIKENVFHNSLQKMSNISIDKYWFLSNNSKKSRIDKNFLFHTSTGEFFFNKRYFWALSLITDKLK